MLDRSDPQTFRLRPEAVRSLHPTHSASAIGANAIELTRDHKDSVTPCDELSPYGKLASSDDGYILLLGAGHNSNTTFHHIEEIAGVDYHMQSGFAEASVVVRGEETRRKYMLHKYGTPRQFEIMEDLFIEHGIQKTGRIGESEVRLVNARAMVRITMQCVRANARILCKS